MRGRGVSGFDIDLLDTVVKDSINIAQEIVCLYNDDDSKKLYIFLGASPAYAYYAFIHMFPLHQAVNIPLSGMSYVMTDKFTEVSPEQKSIFSEYINSFVNRIEYEEVVLIDHCHTCKSVTAFINLFKENVKSVKIHFVNLVDNVTRDYWINKPEQQSSYQITKSSTLNAISGHKLPRLTPKYTFWHDLMKGKKLKTITMNKEVIDIFKEKLEVHLRLPKV
jgi:hypothetical protein